jgi:hypothetical protein
MCCMKILLLFQSSSVSSSSVEIFNFVCFLFILIFDGFGSFYSFERLVALD